MRFPARLSLPPSVGADAEVLRGAAALLAYVESLPPDATGVVHLGERGMMLIESRMVCWAVAAGMEPRLSRLLRQQRSPPLEPDYVQAILADCKRTGRPLGEALLATGEISEDGLRAALFGHVTEAIAFLSRSGVRQKGFVRHDGKGYDPRFVFSTAEIMVALGARRNQALAAAARRALHATLVPDSRGLCFVRDGIGPVAIAVEGKPALKVPEIAEICEWGANLFDITALFDKSVRLATGSCGEAEAIVTWRGDDAQFVAVCASRAASAVLVARLEVALCADPKAGADSTVKQRGTA